MFRPSIRSEDFLLRSTRREPRRTPWGGSRNRRLCWDRGADLLSDLITRIYLDFVRGGSPERLIPVFHHNQMDLRGLAALSSRILSLVSDAENVGQDGLEIFGVSRICEKRGENARARKLYEKSIASVLPTETDRAARHSLARLAKREGDFNLACELWKEALGNSRQGYDAYEQLAMYYEHKARDPEQARQIVRQALDELRRANQVGDIAPGPYREIKARFDQRMTRLERKSRRPLLDSPGYGISGSMVNEMEEGRKRELGIIAGILVARHLKTPEDLHDNRSSPRTESLVASAVQWESGS